MTRRGTVEGLALPGMLKVVETTMVRTRARMSAASLVVETLSASRTSRSRRAVASRAKSRALLLETE